MYFYTAEVTTERERKEKKMSGEERNIRNPRTRHKTTKMTAYKFFLCQITEGGDKAKFRLPTNAQHFYLYLEKKH